MNKLSGLKPEAVFGYFEEISSIPHGSQNMDKISAYLEDFAKKSGFKYVRDGANNIIIYKDGTKGYENHAPVILQGHIDMVCQKTPESSINFEEDGLDIFIDGDFVKAKGTTLGADNGIAVAMIMAILTADDLEHPPIEAVFTTDEEIGMIGASQLDVSLLKGKQMINLDSEEEDIVTVSCAGGSDFKTTLSVKRCKTECQKVTVKISGLTGGHSGIEIDKGRVNANILAGRLLAAVSEAAEFEIISINGGDKANAITNSCIIEVGVQNVNAFTGVLYEYAALLKKELEAREQNLEITCEVGDSSQYFVFDSADRDRLIFCLLQTPTGVIDMSCEIEGLVETSLNLGILKTSEESVYMQYALRSNKSTALDFLEMKMKAFAKVAELETEITGRYEPWEFKAGSEIQKLYIDTFREALGKTPTVAAMHAGLECAVFSASIPGLDCIAIGPEMYGVHTVEERLSISSTGKIYGVLCDMLSKM